MSASQRLRRLIRISNAFFFFYLVSVNLEKRDRVFEQDLNFCTYSLMKSGHNRYYKKAEKAYNNYGCTEFG